MPRKPSLRERMLDLFTAEEWAEIYYALDGKAQLIKQGFYGPEEKRGEDKWWREQLTEIASRIADEIDV